MKKKLVKVTRFGVLDQSYLISDVDEKYKPELDIRGDGGLHGITCYCKLCMPSREQELDSKGDYVNPRWIKT